jgi:iron(III) transport system ATP-binding protein
MIDIINVTKRYRDYKAVDHLNLHVKRGEIFTLLGPSGCGKTTTLRCVAGFVKPDEGEIVVSGETLVSTSKGLFVEPRKRGMGMVFQNWAVWPHMNVFDNIAYGLRIQKLPKDEIERRVKDTLQIVKMEGFEKRYPHQLSGGQQQRVSLARTLAAQPRILLFDEPLSNLDAKLRDEMRFELREIQRKVGTTSIYVTHDQAEAFILSDRLAVMHEGRIHQVGDAEEIYGNPSTQFVADFIGLSNLLPVLVGDGFVTFNGQDIKCNVPHNVKTGENATLSIKAENVLFVPPSARDCNILGGQIVEASYLGASRDYSVRVGEKLIRVRTAPSIVLEKNQNVSLQLKSEHCVVIAKTD